MRIFGKDRLITVALTLVALGVLKRVAPRIRDMI